MPTCNTSGNVLVILDDMGCDWPVQLIAAAGSSLHCTDGNNVWDDEVLQGQPADVLINGLPFTISTDVVCINASRDSLVGFGATQVPGVVVHVFDPDDEGPHEAIIGGVAMRGYYATPCQA
jgi:hypothetical protein